MRFLVGKFVFGGVMGLSLFLSVSALKAQDDGPPKVLVIQREYLKPSKGGMLHEQSEVVLARAFSSGEPNVHYLAMDAMSGAARSLFLSSYDSFAEWQKEQSALAANKTKATAVDHAISADGDLLASVDSAALVLRPDLSFNKGHIKGTRYFEITQFIVKPGHRREFTELAHIYADAYRKVAANDHWDCFEVMYGNPTPGMPVGTSFIVINTMESLAEADAGLQHSDKVAAALGAGSMQKVDELAAASIEMQTTNLFQINPRMSNPRDEWVKGEPDFWKAPSSSTEKASN